MKVNIKEFNMDLQVKQKGIEFAVYNTPGKGGDHLGDLVLTNARLIWCPGRTTPDKGKRITWEKFIKLMEAL